MSQEELARLTGLSERSIRRLESGDVRAPRPATVRLLADAFGLSAPDRDAFVASADGPGLEPPPKAERTLPADVAGFVGRHRELRDLLDAVRAPSAQALPVSPIYAVDGMAGVGKTAFAVHLAHRLAGRFPDGQRLVELRAHAPGRPVVDPATALATLLQADGVAAARIPTGLDALAGLWRERLAGRRMLLLLDDAADAAHVAPLLPGTPGCLVLITSRRRLVTLPGVVLLSLDTLPPADAAKLFVHRAGRRAGGEDAAIARITQLCSHLPLAITLTAARLHLHPTWSVTDLADDLARARDRISALASGDLAVSAAFDLSYRDLPDDQRRLFRRLALHPGPEVDEPAAAALDGTTPAGVRLGLDGLLEHNLLTEPRPGRYRFHDLIAAHARSQADADPESEREAALDRLLDHYLAVADAAATVQGTGYLGAGAAPAPAPEVADPRRAADWFAAEQNSLAEVVALAAARRHRAAVVVPAAMQHHLRSRGPYDLAVRLHRSARTVAGLTGDDAAFAQASLNLAHIQRMTSDPAAADTVQEALDRYRRAGDRRGEGRALDAFARNHYLADDFPAAIAAAEQSLDVSRQAGDVYGQAAALELLARVHSVVGDYPAAAVAGRRAVALHRQLPGLPGQGTALMILADVQFATGDCLAALASAEESRTLSRQADDRLVEANALDTMAIVRRAIGDHAAGADAARLAHALFVQVGSHHGQVNALVSLAWIQYEAGDHPAAAATVGEAHELCRRLDDRSGLANVRHLLGVLAHADDDAVAATAELTGALEGFREIGDPDGEADVLNGLGRLLLDRGDPAAAEERFTAALELGRRIGAPRHEARALEGLGTCLRRRGRDDEGRRHLREALAIYRRIHSPAATRTADALV